MCLVCVRVCVIVCQLVCKIDRGGGGVGDRERARVNVSASVCVSVCVEGRPRGACQERCWPQDPPTFPLCSRPASTESLMNQ